MNLQALLGAVLLERACCICLLLLAMLKTQQRLLERLVELEMLLVLSLQLTCLRAYHFDNGKLSFSIY